MKRISMTLAAFLMLIVTIAGCAGSGVDGKLLSVTEEMSSASDYGYDKADSESPSLSYSDDISDVNGALYENRDNKVIRTAEMTIQTTEFDQAVAALSQLTESRGGYYESAQVSSGSYRNQNANRWAYYVVRIPKEYFAQFRDGSGSIGYVCSVSEDAQNVGEVYYDTEARLETLTTKRDRLLALLEKAEAMEDIITLEDALADVQYEIDIHTSTLRKYDSLIDFSTFTIHLEEVTRIVEEPKAEDGFGAKLLASLREGLSDFARALQNFTLWAARNLLELLIFAAFAAVVLVVVLKKIRKRKSANKTEHEV